MAKSSPEGIELGKGSQLVSMELSINKEKVLSIESQKRNYSEKEVDKLVYNIIDEYAKHCNIIIDGAKLNELFEQFKKK